MQIYSVYDEEFRPYGKVLKGCDTGALLDTLEKKTPLPDGTDYQASDPALEALPVMKEIRDNIYGGMPVQLGWCNGHNTKLNCLEYHRDSEINLGTNDFILLLAKEEEIVDGVLDTSKIKAFRCPAGVMIEVYATTLHYAPCSASKGAGFRVLVALPKGTNVGMPDLEAKSPEDFRLWARNKWLLAHEESSEAAQGAYVGLSGENIDISNII
ncbi:MAG: DUF4867 family protein [Candidatus Limivicinus sp.]|jgi:hypothetical protein